MLTVRVLGPLEVCVDGRPVRLTSGKLRTLLAVLAMAAGSPLPVKRLAVALWDDEPPSHVRRVVQTYLARLRSALGDGLIVTEPAGYRLRVAPEHVDASRFTRLLETAALTPDPAGERALLDEALALWRGDPFDGVQSDWLARSDAPRLTERYLAAIERRVDMDLAGGRHGEQVARLRELTARYQLRESLWVRLLVVLARCGRQAEALAQYETIRRRVAEELGTDPGPELRQIHAALLAGRPQPRPVRTADLVVPRQLPADIDEFTGRASALAALDRLLDDEATAVVISAIAGTAGVGKTALAVHWAHRVADRFRDGQLYVDLRGFHPTGQALPPTEAVRGFLAALGVDRVPSDVDDRIGLFRSRLAGKRILVVLDNARDAEHVRPLLPGSPTCLVLVTSRSQLTSLVAAEGAKPLLLDLLPADEARQLLARRLGTDRVAAEPVATDQILSRCAGLPLAVAIAAARAATRPGLPLEVLAAELRDERSNLDALSTGDTRTDARTVFSWSYRAVSPPAARAFRLLGLHPGREISTPAAASLVGLAVPQARPLLAELTRAHLLTEPNSGRYAFHDLLRSYAGELAHRVETAAECRTARQRMLDHYLHSAHAAALQLSPRRDPIDVTRPGPGVTLPDLTGHEQAHAWLTTEHAALLSALGQAAGTGFDAHAWRLAWALADFLDRRGDWLEWTAAGHTALAAATRLGDRAGQAHANSGLANAYAQLGRHEEAARHYQHAIDAYHEVGDLCGEARTHHNFADLFERQDRPLAGLHHAQRSLDLFRAAGHRIGQARALNAVGWLHARLCDFQQAIAHCQQALALNQELGDRAGAAATWDSLGYAHHRFGSHRDAVACYRRALDLYRDIGSRHPEARTLARIGDSSHAAGDTGAGRTAWRQALAILEDLNHSEAEQVRAKLDGQHPPAR